jgi:hypothetical protein
MQLTQNALWMPKAGTRNDRALYVKVQSNKGHSSAVRDQQEGEHFPNVISRIWVSHPIRYDLTLCVVCDKFQED